MAMSCKVPGFLSTITLESNKATVLIAWYTLMIHFLAGFYFLDIYRGSNCDWAPSPTFEYSGKDMKSIALKFAIFCFVYMAVASLGLIRGVVKETRIYYFPWLWLTFVEILLFIYHTLWLMFRYPYDTSTIVTAAAVLLLVCYHIYLYLVVLSNYRFLKKMQSPTLIFSPE